MTFDHTFILNGRESLPTCRLSIWPGHRGSLAPYSLFHPNQLGNKQLLTTKRYCFGRRYGSASTPINRRSPRHVPASSIAHLRRRSHHHPGRGATNVRIGSRSPSQYMRDVFCHSPYFGCYMWTLVGERTKVEATCRDTCDRTPQLVNREHYVRNGDDKRRPSGGCNTEPTISVLLDTNRYQYLGLLDDLPNGLRCWLADRLSGLPGPQAKRLRE